MENAECEFVCIEQCRQRSSIESAPANEHLYLILCWTDYMLIIKVMFSKVYVFRASVCVYACVHALFGFAVGILLVPFPSLSLPLRSFFGCLSHRFLCFCACLFKWHPYINTLLILLRRILCNFM